MRILELTQRGDELHAICTRILYCFASRAVRELADRDDTEFPYMRGMGRRVGARATTATFAPARARDARARALMRVYM